MKRLRSYGEDLDDVTGKDWERREMDSDRSLSRRRFYLKSESIRRPPSSLYDRSTDDDRDAMRPPRKRFEHELDGFDRRKIFDRYRDGGGGSSGGVDRTMHASFSRDSYGSERLHRSESFSSIRRDFPKGFRSERDRSRRESCTGLSWRRLSYGKEATDEERRSSSRDSEDRGNTRSRDSSSGEQAKYVDAVKSEMEKARGESCSSSEMEEGELVPDPLPAPLIRRAERCSQTFNDTMDAQNFKEKVEVITEASSENKDVQLSMKKSDSFDGASCGERSIEIEVDQITRNTTLHEEQIEVVKELDEERRGERDCSIERRGQQDSLEESLEEAKKFSEDACEEEKVEDTSFQEKIERISSESSFLPFQSPNIEMKNQQEELEVRDSDLVEVYTSPVEILEGMAREVQVIEATADVEGKEDSDINLEVVQQKGKGFDEVGFEADQRKRKDIGMQAGTGDEAGCCSSVKEIKSENKNLTLKPMAEKPRDKGKNIAHSLSNMADSADDEDVVEGPSQRGFELFFQDRIIQQDMATTGNSDGRMKNEKLKLEPLDLSLSLPGVLPDHSSKPPNSYQSSPAPTKSIQSFPSSFQTISDGFTNSISFSSSHPFVHNPSCSLTQNSLENFEQSVGSRPIFQGVDQLSGGVILQSQACIEPKRRGGAGALFHRVLNGNHLQSSHQTMNGHHKSKSNAFLRQQSFSRQPSSPPQSVGSHDTLSEYSKNNKLLTRERSFNSLTRSEKQEGEQIVVDALSAVERIITRIVSEPLHVMERLLHDMTDHSMEYLKDSICKMLINTEKRGQLHALQGALQRRSDLTVETMARCSQTLLEILVALKTGLPDLLQRLNNNVSSYDLIEIYHNLKCRNIVCRSMLPADDCDCKICAQKNGFCSACMCLVCSKFDMASNTCSWVGCDVCLHWCHTDCGLQGSYIRNGRSSSVALGATEMQFHCVACGHPSEMFGFVKEVFKMCSKDWKVENLAKELQYVRRIFCASNDMRGKSLYQFAGQMLVKLVDKNNHSEVIKNIMSFLLESESTISNAALYSAREPSGNIDQRGNAVAFPIEKVEWLPPVSSSKASHIPHKGAASTTDDDQMCGQRKEAAISQMHFEKKPAVDELESVVGFKQAEAKMYQERAENARREAEGLKRIALAKSEKIDNEYGSRMAKLQLQEAEEKRRQKLEELQVIERAHHDFINLKMRMEAEIKDLLLKMEATRRNFNA